MKARIFDTTLRDGEQTPGISLTPDEKRLIARKLDELGVDVIEAGSAITSQGEREGIKKKLLLKGFLLRYVVLPGPFR